MVSQLAATARKVTRELVGVVVSAGLMQKTVKVRVGGKKWNPRVQQMLAKPRHLLVHDPNSSLVTGDVVSVVPGWRTSRHKRHVVKQIIAPYGTAIEERPRVPTLEERIVEYEEKRRLKDERRAARRAEETAGAAESSVTTPAT